MIPKRKSEPVVDLSETSDYEKWSSALDVFATGRLVDLAHLSPLPESAGVTIHNMLANRCIEALNLRFDHWRSQFEREIGSIAGPSHLSPVLRNARSRLLPIWDLANHGSLAEPIRDALSEMIRDSLRMLQQNLERDAMRDIHSKDQLLAALKEVRFTSVMTQTSSGVTSTPPETSSDTNPGPTGRRIIL